MVQNNRAEVRHTRDPLSDRIIGFAIDIHRELGPGLLESAYCECLAHELSVAGIPFEREVPVPLRYKAVTLACSYRLDFVVQHRLILEIKSVDALLPVHEAQLLTYLKLTGKPVGLLLNFKEVLLKNGILRRVNSTPPQPTLCSSAPSV